VYRGGLCRDKDMLKQAGLIYSLYLDMLTVKSLLAEFDW
jgi:hypothetical protein